MATISGISTTGTISAPGVGSGLDVNGMVSKLMSVEQRPLTQLATQEAKFQAKLSNLGSISGALSALQTAAQGLSSASTVAYGASSNDTTVLTATAASDALAGTSSVTVNKLAQTQKLLTAGVASSSAAVVSGGDTTLTFTLGTITGTPDPVTGIYAPLAATFAANAAKTPVAVLISSSNNTLTGIRDAINAAGAGVTASIINDGGSSPYRLAIASNDTGLANSLTISSSNGAVAGSVGALLAYDPQGTQALSQTQAARNADLSIGGVAIASSSNTVAGAIQGVTLSLSKETAVGTPVTVTVQRSTSSITASLSALVKAYNSANTTIAGITAKGALMQGDSGVLGLQRQVIGILRSTQGTSGSAYTTLSSLGISFQKDGSLAFDTTKASAALSADAAGVIALTAAIGKAIDTAATSIIGSAGPLSAKVVGINRSIKDIGSRRTQIQAHLDAVQKAYQKQFSALDTLISSMNSTSNFLTTQLDGIANMLKK
jgi:flagellar hook-associated protein 2